MHIGILSKADQFGGGASRVASDLHDWLPLVGATSDHWRSFSRTGWPEGTERLYAPSKFAHALIRKAAYFSQGLGLQELIPWEMPRLRAQSIETRYDLLHVHDTTSAISPYTLRYFSKKLPVLWTFHDCSPFTGGCLVPFKGCDRFKTHCGPCPASGVWPLKGLFDFTQTVDRRKREVLSGSIVCAAPSRWMADLAESSGKVSKVHVLSNGVDTTIFAPSVNKAELRAKLGIPRDALAMLWIAGHFKDPVKGSKDFLALVDEMKRSRPLFLIIVGKLDAEDKRVLDARLAGIPNLVTGFIDSRSALSKYYKAADVFIYPSYRDNQPLVVMEAMATGLPVISYSTQGIPEMVDHGKTGWLAKTGDIGALCALARSLTPENLVSCSRAALKKATIQYSKETCARVHHEFYTRMLNGTLD